MHKDIKKIEDKYQELASQQKQKTSYLVSE